VGQPPLAAKETSDFSSRHLVIESLEHFFRAPQRFLHVVADILAADQIFKLRLVDQSSRLFARPA
jgi:hypothetical protein